jgi:hypothetical protein
MDHETELREKARAALRTGRIPARVPANLWGGRGSGEACTICGLLVAFEQTELELDFGGSGATFHLHAACFAAWESERRRAEDAFRCGTPRLVSPQAPGR